jgi:hypothetical protein
VNLFGIIGSMPTVQATLKRRGAGGYVKGVYSGGTVTTSTIPVVFWPASAREIERLPEGLRTREVIGIAAKIRLMVAEDTTGTQADVLTVEGRDYEIQKASAYISQAGYCHALAVRAP